MLEFLRTGDLPQDQALLQEMYVSHSLNTYIYTSIFEPLYLSRSPAPYDQVSVQIVPLGTPHVVASVLKEIPDVRLCS